MFRAVKSEVPAISLAKLPPRAVEIHRMRPDVFQTFDLSTPKGRRGLYWWYYLHAYREMCLQVRAPEDLTGPVNEPVTSLPLHGPVPVTWLMREFWVRGLVPEAIRSPSPASRWMAPSRFFHVSREPTSVDEQWRLVSWYFCRGLQDYGLEGLITPEQAAQLLRQNDGGVSSILAMVHAYATDVDSGHPAADSKEWLHWCAGEGQKRFAILAHPLLRDRLFAGAASAASHRRTYDLSAFGVNLIGHAGARSGVGEDLRMAARALEAAKIPFVVRNVQASSGVAAEEHELHSRIADHSPFSVNMFCMAGMETVTALTTRREWLEGKANIGFWPWELAKWPDLWGHAPGMMDELWASSSFTASAYRRSTAVPVRQVPMAVDVEASEGLGRAGFGLPSERFLFGYSFDGHSTFSRKNPEACIDAFRLAFPEKQRAVGLVLKGLRVSHHPTWRNLERRAAADSRIVLISASMRRAALLDLYRAIDCFVSLHRSEGFGRNIAECMLLGKPVIATNYSGNVDFTRDSTAALVDADLRPVAEGEYPFGAGQCWAYPSISQAAEQMQRIFVDERWRTRIATAGQSYIRAHHSPEVVGEKFRQELNRLTAEINKRTIREYL